MRDGNTDRPNDILRTNIVCSLPMRDGNYIPASLLSIPLFVCSLPMRDGNREDAYFADTVRQFVAYL